MSIRYSMIPREASSHITFFEPSEFDMDLLNDTRVSYATKERVITSAVRFIARDYNECNQIPRVIGAYWLAMPDQWGNSWLVEVEYSRRGYRSTFAGREVIKDDKPFHHINWQVYMD